MEVEGRHRWATGTAERPEQLLDAGFGLDELLSLPAREVPAALGHARRSPLPAGARALAPVGGQEVWAAGVTYEVSREARTQESGRQDVYGHVYSAERPELFFKSTPGRVRGPGEAIAVRADSGWDVPEPELVLVLNRAGEVAGYAIGDDVSSRSIEGENPLYLPQAKVFEGACAIGPCITLLDEAGPPARMEVELVIRRQGATAFRGRCPVARLRRSPEELASWLFRSLDFPCGAFLMTGTGVVPGPDYSLREGDEVAISITGLGRLVNPVGRPV